VIDNTSFIFFLAAALVLLVTPGPAVLYIVARSIDQGPRAGLVSCVGMTVGGLIQVAAAAFGLSSLLMSSALAFSIVKYAGAAYLMYLGVRTLMSGQDVQPILTPHRTSLRRVFSEAVVVQVLNPKAALFFLAFLPQFVDPSRGALGQVFALGGSYLSLALMTASLYAILGGKFGLWIRSHVRLVRAQRYFTGVTYLVLGLVTAVSGRE